MMDDGGVDVPVRGGLWRQSLARVSGTPPNLRFQPRRGPVSPAPHTWAQIDGDRDRDDGPLGPYYSIGFVEAAGVFYATEQRNWNWSANGPSPAWWASPTPTDHGETWRSAGKPFAAPLGNLTFIDGGGRGGVYPDGYVYAIGTSASSTRPRLLLGRVRPGVANVTDPARWQWFAGLQAGSGTDALRRGGRARCAAATAGARLELAHHLSAGDLRRPLHRYLLTFTYSYPRTPPASEGGAELVILEAPTP